MILVQYQCGPSDQYLKGIDQNSFSLDLKGRKYSGAFNEIARRQHWILRRLYRLVSMARMRSRRIGKRNGERLVDLLQRADACQQ